MQNFNQLFQIPNVDAYVTAIKGMADSTFINAILKEASQTLPASFQTKVADTDYRASVDRLVTATAGIVISAKTVADEGVFDQVVAGLNPQAELVDDERKALFASLIADAEADSEIAVSPEVYIARLQKIKVA